MIRCVCVAICNIKLSTLRFDFCCCPPCCLLLLHLALIPCFLLSVPLSLSITRHLPLSLSPIAVVVYLSAKLCAEVAEVLHCISRARKLLKVYRLICARAIFCTASSSSSSSFCYSSIFLPSLSNYVQNEQSKTTVLNDIPL